MILSATNHLIEVVLGGAVGSTQWPFTTFYVDHTSSTLTPGAQNGTTNNTTAVTVMSSPGASTQRQAKYISFYNADTIANTITIRFDDGTNERIVLKVLVQPGETVEYNQGAGWRVIDPYGIRKEGSVLSQPRPTAIQNVGFNAANITGVRTVTSGSTIAQYLGKAEYPYTTAQLRYRVTTAAATITWAEVAIASGTFALGANQSLTTRGSTNVAGSINSTGLKQTTISLTGVTTGMDLYALVGNNASTPAALRAGLADNITAGFLSSASAQPSAMGANTSFTLGADTDLNLWYAVQFT